MAKGILFVETQPKSPEDVAAYHEWYNGTHMKEILAVEGFVSARRFEPVGHEGPFIAICEIDDDDIEAVRDRLAEAARSVPHTAPVGVRLDPPPTTFYFREIATAP